MKLYFLMGFFTALLMMVFIIGYTSPLEANINNCGSQYNPCYVKIVE